MPFVCGRCHRRPLATATRCEVCRRKHNAYMRRRIAVQRAKSEFTIYILKNKKNGKAYVGLTHQTLRRRLNQHWRAARSTETPHCMAITMAIRKYGRQAFEAIVLRVVKTRREADRFERLYIKRFGTLSPFGYNLSSGGSLGPTRHSPSTLRLMSERHKARWARMSSEKRALMASRVKATLAKLPLQEKQARARLANHIKLQKYSHVELSEQASNARAAWMKSTTHAERSAASKKTWTTRRARYGSSGGNTQRSLTRVELTEKALKTWVTRRRKYGPNGRKRRRVS